MNWIAALFAYDMDVWLIFLLLFFFLCAVVRFYQDYQEPEESQTSSPAPPRGDANPLHPSAPVSDEEKVVLPLSPNTLTQNLGIPIVVVLTKVSVSLCMHNMMHIFSIIWKLP